MECLLELSVIVLGLPGSLSPSSASMHTDCSPKLPTIIESLGSVSMDGTMMTTSPELLSTYCDGIELMGHGIEKFDVSDDSARKQYNRKHFAIVNTKHVPQSYSLFNAITQIGIAALHRWPSLILLRSVCMMRVVLMVLHMLLLLLLHNRIEIFCDGRIRFRELFL